MGYKEESKAKIESTGVEGTKGSKSNDCEASLRKGSLPKSEAVTTAKADDGEAHKKAVQAQCKNDTGVRTIDTDVKQVVSAK